MMVTRNCIGSENRFVSENVWYKRELMIHQIISQTLGSLDSKPLALSDALECTPHAAHEATEVLVFIQRV